MQHHDPAPGTGGGDAIRRALANGTGAIALARAAALPPTATATAFVQFCIEAMGGAPAASHPS